MEHTGTSVLNRSVNKQKVQVDVKRRLRQGAVRARDLVQHGAAATRGSDILSVETVFTFFSCFVMIRPTGEVLSQPAPQHRRWRPRCFTTSLSTLNNRINHVSTGDRCSTSVVQRGNSRPCNLCNQHPRYKWV